MDNITKEQELLFQITKIIETEYVNDANRLLGVCRIKLNQDNSEK